MPHEPTQGVQCTQGQKTAPKWVFPNLSEIFQEFPTALKATEIKVERALPKSPRQQSELSLAPAGS
jgi:hypothetical protein